MQGAGCRVDLWKEVEEGVEKRLGLGFRVQGLGFKV